MESGVCSRNEGMAATGLDGTSIQFSCTESTCIVSMYRIDTIPLLHASAATTRGRGDFYLTVWHVVDCFLCVSCQIQTEKTTSPSKNLILSYSHIRKLYILTEKVDRGSSRGAPSSSKEAPSSSKEAPVSSKGPQVVQKRFNPRSRDARRLPRPRSTEGAAQSGRAPSNG